MASCSELHCDVLRRCHGAVVTATADHSIGPDAPGSIPTYRNAHLLCA